MYLLSDVLDDRRLDGAAAARLYGLRWGVEVMYRALKQTLDRRKLLSDAPRNARVELSWAMVGLWTLALIKAERCPAVPLSQQGTAAVLRLLRRAMTGVTLNLSGELARIEADTYQRTGPKTARRYPHKKRDRPPGKPRARNATECELALAQELEALDRAA